MRLASALLLSAVLTATLPAHALAQSAPAAGTLRVDTPLLPPVIFTPEPTPRVVETGPDGFKTAGALTLGRWTIQSNTAWNVMKPQTQVSARVTYAAKGGVQLSVGVIGRQRYFMPLAVAQPLGSDGVAQDPGASIFGAGGRAMVWDTQIRVEKLLKNTNTVQIRAVGELFNLFDVSALSGGRRSKADEKRATGSLLTTRAARFGLALGF